MAKPQPTRLTVRRDHTLDADLATVMRTGMTQTEAVRYALHLLAQGLDWMWTAGHVDPDTMPPAIGIQVPPRNAPTSAYDAGVTPRTTGRVEPRARA